MFCAQFAVPLHNKMNNMSILKNILLVIVAPKMGWEEVNRSSFPTQDLLSKAFYPLLAALAVTEFIPMLYDSTLSLSVALMLAITSFASYFITLYLTSYLLDGFYPELNPTHSINSRHNDFIIYSIIYLVILKIIDNLMPTHFAPLYFLVTYVIFIIYCGAEFAGIEITDKNKLTKFVLIASALIIFVPVIIQLLLKGIFIHIN